VDRYKEAVLKLVEEKRKERGIVRANRMGDRVPEGDVVDLMEALKRSLGGPAPSAQRRRESASKRATPARSAAAPKTTRRKSA
jgi:DNA end-binding protein Ku